MLLVLKLDHATHIYNRTTKHLWRVSPLLVTQQTVHKGSVVNVSCMIKCKFPGGGSICNIVVNVHQA